MGPHDECVDDSRDGSKQYPKSQASRDIPDHLVHVQDVDAEREVNSPDG